MSKFITHKITWSYGRTEWAVGNAVGYVSFWVEYGLEAFGGVEIHYTKDSKPDYLKDEPLTKTCLINGGDCWSDGSSLYAHNHFIPHVLPHGDDAIFSALEYEHAKYFEEKKDNEQD